VVAELPDRMGNVMGSPECSGDMGRQAVARPLDLRDVKAVEPVVGEHMRALS